MTVIETFSFGEWVGERRKALDMAQRELALQAACAVATIKKIEGDERRPSRELAGLLASALRVPSALQATFIECARGLRPVDALAGVDAGQQSSASQPAVLVNLPVQSTPFIGRQVELAQIRDYLADENCRLLTLVGSGGAGKTRLALETARALRANFADDVLFVSLASITDAALIPGVIANALRLTLSDISEVQVLAYLRAKTMLLILDNCEQLGNGLAWLSDLLAAAPSIKMLATSRERLQLAEEWVYNVPELDTQQAIALFQQTAHRLNSVFDTAGQQSEVMTICQLVENLPLAIELAAGWTSLMSCAEIARHIQEDIDFLTASTRNVPERHRSLRAVFDHSWKLLTPAEQRAMLKLSVFRGWTADESSAIAGANLLMLRALVDKSLVRAAGNGRYDLHELTRQYAADKLREAGKEADVRQLHSQTYIKLAERQDASLYGPQAVAAFARLDQEQDNFRLALSWLLETSQRDAVRHLVDVLFLYWLRRGQWQEGERWSVEALGAVESEDSIYLCRALTRAATFISLQGRYQEAYTYSALILPMARRLQDPGTLGAVLLVMAQAVPDAQAAEAFLGELLTLFEEMGADWNPGERANTHLIYGDRLQRIGRSDQAADHYRASLEIFRRIGDVDTIAYPLGNLGRLALQAGRLDEAHQLIMESLAISRASGNRVGIVDWLRQYGSVLLAQGDVDQAQSVFEEVLALSEEMGSRRAQLDMLASLAQVGFLKNNLPMAETYARDALVGYGDIYRQLNSFQPTSDFRGTTIPFELADTLRVLALIEQAVGHAERSATLLQGVEHLMEGVPRKGSFYLEQQVEDALKAFQFPLSETLGTEKPTLDALLSYALDR